MVKTIFYSLAALVPKTLFLPLENKIHIFAPLCNILYICKGETFMPFLILSIWVACKLKFILGTFNINDLAVIKIVILCSIFLKSVSETNQASNALSLLIFRPSKIWIFPCMSLSVLLLCDNFILFFEGCVISELNLKWDEGCYAGIL